MRLLVTRRYGEDSQGTIAMTQQDINIDALDRGPVRR